jgi:hypothetical protein
MNTTVDNYIFLHMPSILCTFAGLSAFEDPDPSLRYVNSVGLSELSLPSHNSCTHDTAADPPHLDLTLHLKFMDHCGASASCRPLEASYIHFVGRRPDQSLLQGLLHSCLVCCPPMSSEGVIPSTLRLPPPALRQASQSKILFMGAHSSSESSRLGIVSLNEWADPMPRFSSSSSFGQ